MVDGAVMDPAADDRPVEAVEVSEDQLAHLAVLDVAARIRINHLKINQRLDVVQQARATGWADAVLASEHMVVAHLGVAVVV
mgnify:CR=1 FL=1